MQNARECYPKAGADAKLRLHGDVSAEPPDQRAHMGEPYTFAGAILHAGAPEQVENSVVILLGDAATVVADLEVNETHGANGPNRDPQRTVPVAVLDGIIEKVAENLFERQPVGNKNWKRSYDIDLTSGFRDLMLHVGCQQIEE